MNKCHIIAERLAKRVFHELRDTPLYVIQPRDDGRVSSAMIGHSKGLFFPNLDIAMQPELEALGEWRGPGVCVIADVQSIYRAGLYQYDAERKAVGVILHELCHWIDKPERKEIPETVAVYDRFTEVWASKPKRESQFPVALLGHPESFQRIACHVLYRCNYFGGYCLQPHHLAIGSSYAGLEFLPTALEFIDVLHDEVRECAHLPLRSVAATEPPAELIQLWEQRVLARFVTSPVLPSTNGENNHARPKQKSRNSAQPIAACHLRR